MEDLVIQDKHPSELGGNPSLSFAEPALKTAMKSRTGKPIKKLKEPIPRFHESPNQLNAWYAEGEFDLLSIFKLMTQEAYFLMSVNKKISQMIKAGFSIHSDDDRIKEYFDARFLMMELQTGTSITDLITQVATHLTICSNAFLIKVRDKNFEHAKSYNVDNKVMHPIVGLFIGHPVSIKPRFKWVKFTDKGMVKSKLVLIKWVYVNRRGVLIEFDPEDVIHFRLHHDEGNIFGTPEVLPVIDDIRTLRKIEEDAQLLLYRDLFPMIHYQIENPEMVDHEGQTTELDQAKRDMERMMQDGGIVTDARHDIKFVGNSGKGLDPAGYLEYFQNRVFAGLGVSQTDMGLGENVSGGTAATLSNQLIDNVKYIQRELARQLKETLLLEMALQSPFGIEALREGNRPILKFEEIDLEWKIRKENHLTDQFTKGSLTIDEIRNEMGRDTLDDGLTTRTHPHMYGDLNPTLLEANRKPDPAGSMTSKKPKKKVAANSKKSSATRDLVKHAGSNSNITKSKRPKSKDAESTFLIGDANSLRDTFRNTVQSLVEREKFDLGYKFNVKLSTRLIYNEIKSAAKDQFYNGLTDAVVALSETMTKEEIKLLPKDMESRCISILYDEIDKLNDDVSEKISQDKGYANLASNRIATALGTSQVKYYNLAKALLLKENGINNLSFKKYNNETSLRENISIADDDLDTIIKKISPEHPNSRSIVYY